MKVLRPGPRPAIAFGVLLAIVAAILLVASPSGAAMEALKAIGLLALVLGAVLAHIYLSRIVIGEGYIGWKAGLLPERRVPFEQIDISKPRVLAEPDHPVLLELFDLHGERVQIRLKAFRQQDVQWLLSLPQLKVARGRR